MTSRISVIWHKMIFGERADVCGKGPVVFHKDPVCTETPFWKVHTYENVGCK